MTLGIILMPVGAYLLGSVPFGLLLSKVLFRKDPRLLGSGNIGAANIFREVSPWLGALTLLLDASKGWLPVWIAARWPLSPPWWVCIVGLCAFLGHLYPLYLHLKGGKGVAVGAGIFTALVPGATLGCAVLFMTGVILTRYISIGSTVGAVALPILVLYFKGLHPFFYLAITVSALALWRHRDNFSRLLQGQERPLRRG